MSRALTIEDTHEAPAPLALTPENIAALAKAQENLTAAKCALRSLEYHQTARDKPTGTVAVTLRANLRFEKREGRDETREHHAFDMPEKLLRQMLESYAAEQQALAARMGVKLS